MSYISSYKTGTHISSTLKNTDLSDLSLLISSLFVYLRLKCFRQSYKL